MKRDIFSNLVTKEEMREVQTKTLKIIRSALENCFGPYASNSIISDETMLTRYTKDGHTILSAIKFYNIIEESVKKDLVGITEFIVKHVGDGTTSAVILAEIIFKTLQSLENDYMPHEIIDKFTKTVEEIKKEIKNNNQEFTPDKAYDISLISTNGNKEVSEEIKDLYTRYGNDLFIQVSTGMNNQTMIKEYDGLTIDSGYTESCFINNANGTCKIRNPKIYMFRDPVDTMEMVSLLNAILKHNIFDPIQKSNNGDKKAKFIPTVIIAPKISRDADPIMEALAKLLYSIKEPEYRPPILIITNMLQEKQLNDIGVLCGCKTIAKYINPDTQKKDIQKGLAPTLKTVSDFYGECDLIEADISTTKVINPKHMFITKKDEKGNIIREYSVEYNSLLNFLQSSLKNAIDSQQDMETIAEIKKRLHSLQANMIEYFVGGVSAGDRDSLKDLIDDATKNCKSAAQSGVGYGANFEGLRASKKILDDINSDSNRLSITDINPSDKIFYEIIYNAYKELITCLYASGVGKEKAEELLEESLNRSCPYNLRTKKFDNKVLSSIDTDIVILDAVSKIVTLMFTSNQFFTPKPTDNIYCVAGRDDK